VDGYPPDSIALGCSSPISWIASVNFPWPTPRERAASPRQQQVDGGVQMRGTVEKYNASWRIRYEVGIKADGRRDQRSNAGFKTRRDAEAALADALDRVRRGDVFDARRVTVGEFLDSWLVSKRNIRPKTHRAYAGHIRVYLKPLIGTVPLSALRAEHLDRMYEAIRAGELRRASFTDCLILGPE
jgi:Arm DNA-binding domain/Phage integrase, N-terminal SAM-like domain